MGLYVIFLLYPDCRKLLSQCVVDSLNVVLVEDRFDRRVSIEAGICLIIFGGDWIPYVCMYVLSMYMLNPKHHLRRTDHAEPAQL